MAISRPFEAKCPANLTLAPSANSVSGSLIGGCAQVLVHVPASAASAVFLNFGTGTLAADANSPYVVPPGGWAVFTKGGADKVAAFCAGAATVYLTSGEGS